MHNYASTEALPHSLMHRRLTVDRSTGELAGAARPGESAPTPLSVDEQSAFCQVAVGVAEATISGELPTRRADQLSWALDQITTLHGQPAFGTSPAHGVIPVAVARPSMRPSNDSTLDFSHTSARARQAVGGVSHYDLEIHLPDGRILAGPLEDAPNVPANFPVDDPPSWLKWA